MSNAPRAARTPEIDPVVAALKNAPMSTRQESEEERLGMEEVRRSIAQGGVKWIPCAEVTAKIAEMKRRDP